MPTTTATVTHNGSTHVSLKAMVIPPGSHKSSTTLPPLQSQPMSPGTTATMRPLYNRATRAFLHRDTRLTHTLLEAAFAILHPPLTAAHDSFADDRRKWDILRITLESTVYTSNPSQAEQATLPDSLRTSLSETPHVSMSNLYNRSLSLFTPADSVVSGPNPAYLPSQVLATLVLASLKVECPDFGRIMIEDWLARRDPAIMTFDDESEHENGYSKILDLYCLHVLPQLQQWDYALEFLEYESELSPKIRERLKSRLSILQAQSSNAAGSLSPSSVPDGFGSSTPRPHSPAPSSSSSSSLSTASTHTVVPSSRPNGLGGVHSRSRSSSESSKSDTTARAVTRPHRSHLSSFQNGHAHPSNSRPRQSRTASTSSTSRTQSSTRPRDPSVVQSTAVTRMSTYSLIKAAIQPYLTTSRLATVFLIFVVLPLVSFLVRRRRRAMRSRGAGVPAGSTAMTNAELVRRRLGGIEGGILGRFWGEAIRAVTDTVKMAGSGLV